MKILILILLHVLGITPKIFFFKKNISIGFGVHIYAGKNSQIFVGDNTMIGPFVFVTTEAFSHSKKNPHKAHSGHKENVYIGNNVRVGVGVYHISNAGLGKENPGSESIILKYQIPF